MKQVIIDLSQLLEKLRALDIRAASLEELISYQIELEFINEGIASLSETPEEISPFAASCLKYYDEIRAEFKRRDFEFSNLWNEIVENPEILVSAVSSLSLMDLISAEEHLKEMSVEDEQIRPFYDLVVEILLQRLANCPGC